MKKILKILILAILSVVCLATAVACSNDGDGSGEKGLLCKEINGVYTIYDYVDEDQPKTVLNLGTELGESVSNVRIKKQAFYGNDTIKEIIVPSSVTAIDEGAFAGMKALEKITLPFVGASKNADATQGGSGSAPEKATENERTFAYIFGTEKYDGGSKVSITYKKDATEDRYMPTTLNTVIINAGDVDNSEDAYKIPMYAFNGCVNLTNITLTGDITEIGEYAFSGCKNLITTNVPETVTKIHKGAYNGCTALGEDEFGESVIKLNYVKQIGESAFENAKLKNVVFAENVKIASKAFYNSTVATVTLKGVVEIGDFAFAGCVKLTSVLLDNVNNGIIRQFAFKGAVKLNQVGTTAGTVNLEGFATIENLAFADIFEDNTKITVNGINAEKINAIFGW